MKKKVKSENQVVLEICKQLVGNMRDNFVQTNNIHGISDTNVILASIDMGIKKLK